MIFMLKKKKNSLKLAIANNMTVLFIF